MNFETAGKRALDILDTAKELKSLAEAKRPIEKGKFLTASIVFSAMAIEAYTNALIWLKIIEQDDQHCSLFLSLLKQVLIWLKIIEQDDQQLLKKYTYMEGGERKLKRKSIRTKAKKWTKRLTGKSFGNGDLIKRFNALITLRNKIVHYQIKELNDKQLEEVKESIPYQLVEGGKGINNQEKIEQSIKELFFHDYLTDEITPEKAQESIETARGVMAELNKCYYDFIPPWLSNL